MDAPISPQEEGTAGMHEVIGKRNGRRMFVALAESGTSIPW